MGTFLFSHVVKIVKIKYMVIDRILEGVTEEQVSSFQAHQKMTSKNPSPLCTA